MYFDTWEVRERSKFGTGNYLPVPWLVDQPRLLQRDRWFHRKRGHYPHVVPGQPAMLEFTPTDKMGEADRRTQMKPGKYLRKYFPELTDQQISIHVGEWKSATTETLHFATTPKDIVDVYRYGPAFGSCMSDEKAVINDIHPTQCYGAGDLAVAHLKNGDGDITARCICWPAKEVYYHKKYGDHETLCAALESNGYRSGYSSDFAGARLLKITSPNGEYMCPYLDIAEAVCIGTDFLYVAPHEGWTEHLADSQHGTLGDESENHEDETECSNCAEWVSDYDICYANDENFCDMCCSELFIFCERCQEYAPNNDAVEFDNQWYCDSCIGEVSAQCDLCSDRVALDEIYVTLDGDAACDECIMDKYTPCDNCSGLVCNDDVETTEDNRPFCVDCMQHELEGLEE
jgi:hypothetical protein